MSQRERPAPHGPAAAPRPADQPGAATRPPRAADPPTWDALFDLLPPEKRDPLLTLAARQGLLHAAQLPAEPQRNGPPPADARSLLPRLLDGATDSLTPPDLAGAVDDLPPDLDPQQCAAVATALATPDVCLVQGLPGTGKSRVAAEVIARAARRGQRVLLLAPGPAAFDRILELLAGRPEVCAVRCLGRGESEEALPPAAAGCTWAAHTRRLDEQARQAEARVREAAETCRRRDAEEAVYEHLADLAEQHHRLQARRDELPALRERVPGEVAAEQAEALARLESECRERRAAAESARQAVAAHDATLARLRPLAAARRLTWTWVKALSHWNLAARLVEAEERRRQAESEALAAEADADRLGRERAEHEQAEVARRLADLDDQAAAIDRELALVADKWQQAIHQLAADSPRPPDVAPGAVAESRVAWGWQRDADRRQLDFARAWAEALPALRESLPGRLLEAVNLVAATPAALAADRSFGDGRHGPYDLLVLDEAHAWGDAELLSAARRARRWLLLGEPPTAREAKPEPARAAAGRRGGKATATLPRSAARPPVPPAFHRLWQNLHCDPWGREGDRLLCRLRPLPPQRRDGLEREPVADRPEVELRIATPPGGVPQLAEVVFPPGTPVTEAKAYLFQQLGEAPIPACPATARWREEADRIAFEFYGGAAGESVAVLAEGVRERVAARPAGGWVTCGLEFDRAAGWDRARAEAWVREHVGRHGPGRTVRLDTPHRMAPGLAGFVAELLGTGAYAPSNDGDASVRAEFVPVPPLADGRRNGHGPEGPQRLPPDVRGGAGLEIDLADGRQRARLPEGLRDELPERGLVNLAEAEAVVRRLADAGIRGPVAVLALTAAQAELIRRLARGAALPTDFVIDVPPALRQREAATVIVSLVRSHTHRAVPYGDEPDWLPLALSRGRERLVLVGDPGTLARRAQWDGPLDHLDAAAARRERDLVHHLVRYLQGRGRHARTFRLLEGAPS